jgi:putative addiction module CopG family antidote
MPQDQSAISIKVSIPQPLKQQVDEKISAGEYGSASEFVREAIQEKMARDEELARGWKDLRAKLQAGLDSGVGVEFTPNHFDAMKADLIRKFGAKKNPA